MGTVANDGVRSIRPNDTVPKTVRSYFRNRRLTWRETTVPWVRYKSTDLGTRWGFRTSIHFSEKRKTTKILTLPLEDFWPASTGLLWFYSSFSGFTTNLWLRRRQFSPLIIQVLSDKFYKLWQKINIATYYENLTVKFHIIFFLTCISNFIQIEYYLLSNL